MVVGMFGPTIDVGPLGALALWAILALGVLAVLGSVTLGGAVAFVLLGVAAVLVIYFGLARLINRAAGRR